MKHLREYRSNVTVHGFRSTFASWAEEAGFKESRTNNCNDFWKDRLFEAHVQKPIQLCYLSGCPRFAGAA
jgi:hypothetical protein